MRNLYKIFDKIMEKKFMLRFTAFPGGRLSVGVYDNEKQTRQKMYETNSIEELEKMLMKDFKHLFSPSVGAAYRDAVIIPPMPTPPGFPKPPGVK